MKDFEIIPHTADLEICVYGKTTKELFRNALIGMFQIIKPIAKDCEYKNDRLFCKKLTEKREISLSALNIDLLLVDFLSEALYLSDVNNEAYLEAEISQIDDTSVEAIIYGVKVEGFEVVEIKAVTYHNLKIIFENGYYKTNIVFDI